jgi:hypothetical protein
MEYKSPHFKRYANDFIRIAKNFALNTEGLKVEFYMPGQQAILIEKVENEAYKVHINLQEERIISFQRISGNGKPYSETIHRKYRQYMH